MTFNVSKCKILHIGRNNPEHDYYMHGVKMGTTEIERDMGVMVAKTLKPMEQCEAAAGRAMSVLGQLRRNFHYRAVFRIRPDPKLFGLRIRIRNY